MPNFLDLITLPIYNALFLLILGSLALFLKRRKQAAYAVLKRNFLGYFSNPTGYVFLCLFVLLTSMAAFWPNEFFNANLGTLDQLNNWFVYIMLFFIPAITMSIWAEERRQGTDELLLTLPADDFDIVFGKYLAAVAIFTTSLLFSQVSTFLVLAFLTMGEVDTGLFFTNYLGFWFIGIAMIALGMVASFLTNNLTVGFILGALFNAPLAFASKADVIAPSRETARLIKSFSLTEQFDSFGRGVLSLASMSFFTLVAVFGVYLCMVLVGRRHWSGGKEGNQMFLHYLTRVVSLGAIVLGGSMFFRNNDWLRADASQGQVSSLSPTTVQMIRSLSPERPIVVDAFISAEVPENYAKTKVNLTSILREFESVAKRNKVPLTVRINDNIESNSDDEDLAKDQYGIVPQTVRFRERGAISDQPILMGAAFKSGLEKVVVPFFEPGVPVEYELIRSLNTVSRPARKKLGILKTSANMMGGMSGMQQAPQQPIVTELQKQYDVVEIDATKPIDASLYTVLLAVQPSSLGPEEMINFTEAVRNGLPTAIFEDPMPLAFDMPGTGEPKQQGGPMAMFGGGGQQPKGDIRPLWKLLGIDVPGAPSQTGGINPDICWQQYNPYPVLGSMAQFSNKWIFVSNSAPGAENALSDQSEITKGLQEIMLLYGGVIVPSKLSDTDVTPILSTGIVAGTVPFRDVQGAMDGMSQRLSEGKPTGIQVLAAYVEGKSTTTTEPAAKEATSKEAAEPAPAKKDSLVKCVYVGDADCASQVFFDIRNRPDSFEEIDFRLQNVTFVLNVIDVLAGEVDYPKVRRHVPDYRTLKLVELEADKYRGQAAEQREVFRNEFTQQQQEAESESEKSEAELKQKVEKLQKEGAIDTSKRAELIAALQLFQLRQQQQSRQLEAKLKQLQRERDKGIQIAQSKADKEILKIQNNYKMWAVFLPPIPPLLVGIAVFVSRRLREREGITKSRLK
ncbi:MAG: Gldg family protein [Planctomycetota bacterium]|nr:Gldg family protein [Planctomycetota bacterium]